MSHSKTHTSARGKQPRRAGRRKTFPRSGGPGCITVAVRAAPRSIDPDASGRFPHRERTMKATAPFPRRAILWALLLAGTAAIIHPAGVYAQAAGGDTAYAAADIKYGARIYGSQCTGCHGA